MSLYYEPDPANENDPPLLPPILTPIPVVKDVDVFAKAIEGGSADTSGLYLSFNENRKISLGFYKKPVATGRASNNLKYSIVPGKPEESILLYRMQSLDPGIMMPESGRALQHSQAIELVSKWIKNL